MSITPEQDPLFETLLAARPDLEPDDVDPESPHAVALRDHIVGADPASASEPRRRHIRLQLPGNRRRRLVAVAAVAAAVVAVVATVSGDRLGLGEPAVAYIDQVAATSQDAIEGSGRATVSYEEHWPHGVSVTGEVTFSDGDVEMALHREGGTVGLPNQLTRDSQYRIVDGRLYTRDDNGPWVHNDGRDDFHNALPGFDPQTVLELLRTEAGFEIVGEEDLDGRRVRHLRAAHPEVVLDVLSDLDFGAGELLDPDEFAGLDVWVGLDDDIVYRLDFDVDRQGFRPANFTVDPGEPCPEGSHLADEQLIPVDEAGQVLQSGPWCQEFEEPARVTGTYSIRFHDLGTPATITAPSGAIKKSEIPEGE